MPLGDMAKRSKKKIKLPWDIPSFFSEHLPEGEDEDDEEEEEANAATLLRLEQADKRTKGMTKDEYVHYSECRQASFTYKKAKRFREWAGFGVVTDSKPNDDIVDILGFLLYGIVQTLTEEALRVKHEEDLNKTRNGGTDAQSKKRKRETGLFDPPEEGTTPVTPKHVREAFRRLQAKPIPGRCTVWMGGPRALVRTELKLVGHYTPCTRDITDFVSDLISDQETGVHMYENGIIFRELQGHSHCIRWNSQTKIMRLALLGVDIA